MPGSSLGNGIMYLCILQMRELEKSDKNSKSLLANVLDTEGDYILAPGGKPLPPDVHVHCPLSMTSSLNGLNDADPVGSSSPIGVQPSPLTDPFEKELHAILLEIRVISDKIRAEVCIKIWLRIKFS